MKIIKRRRKSTKLFKYLKVYFEYYDVSYGTRTFCRETKEDFFLKKKSIKWYLEEITYRNEPARCTVYEYKKYVEIKPTKKLIKKFDETYDKYIFMLRERKLKRVVL